MPITEMVEMYRLARQRLQIAATERYQSNSAMDSFKKQRQATLKLAVEIADELVKVADKVSKPHKGGKA